MVKTSEITDDRTVEMLSPCTFTDGKANQLNETDVFATKFNPTEEPLQIVIESAFNKANGGFTVTAMVCADPIQLPLIEVGVTL